MPANILQYVLSLYVLDLTGSATLFASMLSIIIFPRILLTPLAGVLADRVHKTCLMALILLGEAVVLGVYFLLGQAVPISIALVYVLVVILEIGEIFYGGCEAAILPELVPTERLKDAISISKVDDGIVNVTAPLAAALIYDNLSIAAAFAVIGGLNLLSFVLQALIRPKYEAERRDHTNKPSVWKDFKEGISCIRQNAFLRGFLKVMPIANTFFGEGMFEAFDGVLALYDEQAMTPFKTLDLGEGVCYAAGQDIIQTAPLNDAGFSIAGKGIADESSMRHAIYLAIDICRNRVNYDEPLKNPLKKLYHEKRDESEKVRFNIPKAKEPTEQKDEKKAEQKD